MAVPVLALVNYDVCLFQNGGYSQSVYLFLVSYFWREFKGLRSFWQHHFPPTVWLNDPLRSINGPKKSWHDGSADGQLTVSLGSHTLSPVSSRRCHPGVSGQPLRLRWCLCSCRQSPGAPTIVSTRNECRNGCIGVNHSMEKHGKTIYPHFKSHHSFMDYIRIPHHTSLFFMDMDFG